MGIDLHLEWGSCIDLLGSERHLFEQHAKYGATLQQIPQDSDNFKAAFMDLQKTETDSETDRHRIIVAKQVSDFFLFLLKHFKRNHVV